MQQTTEDIHAMIRERFSRIAATPHTEGKFPTGPESAKNLGYAPQEIDLLPPAVTESFCGVGNPLGLREPLAGEIVLDLGCGAGLDALLAARKVGPAGKVIAVDMTDKMLAKARRNACLMGVQNVEFIHDAIEHLPLDDVSVDVALSNGVFNLCIDKPRALAEACRVLKPGGWLLMADILLEDQVTPEILAQIGTWSD